MDDLISKQKLIKAINTWPKFGCDERGKLVPWNENYVPYIHLTDAITAINGMPSAEPHSINLNQGQSSDLISRQQAIDEMKQRRDSAKEWYDETDSDDIRIRADSAIASFIECILTLKKLPSAQPEIVQCRKCKFASGDSRICMKFGHSPIGELDFCAWAERRTE